MSVYYCRARRQTATASLTARPERREGRKLTNQCFQKAKPSTSPTKHPPTNKNPAICYMDFNSAALLSQVMRYQVAPCGSRNQRAIAVDFGRGNISAHSKSVDVSFVHALYAYIAAPVWSEVCCAIYGIVASSLLHLDARALPSRSRKPASARLDRALCFLGILSFVLLYPLYCFIYHLSNAGLNA